MTGEPVARPGFKQGVKEELNGLSLSSVIIDDPLEWYKVPLEIRAESLIKYYKDVYFEYQNRIRLEESIGVQTKIF